MQRYRTQISKKKSFYVEIRAAYGTPNGLHLD